MSEVITIKDPEICKKVSSNPYFESVELYKSEPNGHKFKVGEERTLIGLQSFPEYNGEKVKITAIRKDDDFGRAYYIEGRINEVMNWVYEYRLA